MKRKAAVLLAVGVAALAAGCHDGYEKIDDNTFYVYDRDGDGGVDYKFAFKACQSAGKVVDNVRTLPEHGAGLVTCR